MCIRDRREEGREERDGRERRARGSRDRREACGGERRGAVGTGAARERPADTPYLITAFEAIPLEYYAKLKQAIGPAMVRTVDQLRSLANDSDLSLIHI